MFLFVKIYSLGIEVTAYLEIQNALPVIRRVQVRSVWFRLFGISLNTAKMKYLKGVKCP